MSKPAPTPPTDETLQEFVRANREDKPDDETEGGQASSSSYLCSRRVDGVMSVNVTM
jgi:hypothetical protein